MEHYIAALALLPERFELGVSIGACMADLGRHQDARAVLGAVLERDPNNVRALANLAQLADLAGDRAGAVGYFQRVLAIDPDHAIARKALSQ